MCAYYKVFSKANFCSMAHIHNKNIIAKVEGNSDQTSKVRRTNVDLQVVELSLVFSHWEDWTTIN